MWTTLLVLAIALNFEPTRLGLITLLLIRPHPVPQLLAFLAGSFLTSASAGLLVLLVMHHGVPAGRFNGAKVQVVTGVVALIAAAFLASNLGSGLFNRTRPDTVTDPAEMASQPKVVQWLTARAGRMVQGSSPWFAAALGVSIAIPSVDYLALLLVIATSGSALAVQVTALLTFLTVANVILLIPIASYLLAPERTKAALDRVRRWVLARRRRDYAVLLAIAGVVMIAVGLQGL